MYKYRKVPYGTVTIKIEPLPFENSAKHVPNDGFSPHCVSFGGFPSTSLM
jgi:hypothetical protein